MLYLRSAAGNTLKQGSSRPTRKDLNISTLGAPSEDVGAIDVEDEASVVAPELEIGLRELWVDGMTVEVVENVEFVGFAFEDIEDFMDEAELGGSWSRVIGGVDVGFALAELVSSPAS
jgi:hypothetical protein